jgi:hypothetical protein
MPPKKKAKVQWEWKDDAGDWNSFNSADAVSKAQQQNK